MVASFSLTFLQRESLHNIQHFDFRGGTLLLHWFKKPAKKCKSGFHQFLSLFVYLLETFIHGALGLYLISIVNVVMHNNSL